MLGSNEFTGVKITQSRSNTSCQMSHPRAGPISIVLCRQARSASGTHPLPPSCSHRLTRSSFSMECAADRQKTPPSRPSSHPSGTPAPSLSNAHSPGRTSLWCCASDRRKPPPTPFPRPCFPLRSPGRASLWCARRTGRSHVRDLTHSTPPGTPPPLCPPPPTFAHPVEHLSGVHRQ